MLKDWCIPYPQMGLSEFQRSMIVPKRQDTVKSIYAGYDELCLKVIVVFQVLLSLVCETIRRFQLNTEIVVKSSNCTLAVVIFECRCLSSPSVILF